MGRGIGIVGAMIPIKINAHMKDILIEAIRIHFPVGPDPKEIIGPHAWRNKKYVGEVSDAVVTWRGWSANLAKLDVTYRGVYINFVENKLPRNTATALFGEDFCFVIEGMPSFIVAYVTGIPSELTNKVSQGGFVVRTIGKKIHACMVIPAEDLFQLPGLYWSAQIARLINLQRAILRINNHIPENYLTKSAYPKWLEEMEWEKELSLLDM